MANVHRIVTRVTVIDDVDIPLTQIAVVDVTIFLSAKLNIVSVGQNSVTYDVEILYETGVSSTTIKYGITSNLESDGTDITDETVFSTSVTPELTDTHIRDSTNGRIITNTLVVTIE